MSLTRLLIVLFVLSLTTAAALPIDGLVTQLRLDYAAFLKAEGDFRVRRESGQLNGEDATDYAAWVASLQRRVFEDCAEVVRSAVPFPADLPCPVIVPQATQAGDTDPQYEQTLEERVAALDAELLEGMGEYDEKLLREQERVKAATPNNNDNPGGGGSLDGSDGGQAGSAGGGEQADGNESGAAGARKAPGGNHSSGGNGNRGPGKTQDDTGQPEDIPDGSDDDIVARQLREAATRESDPELKKKLWEEYRKYKQGTR